MPQLFLANISNQVHQFAFRPLELNKVITLQLKEGEQIRVSLNNSADLTTPEIDAILAQHVPYGLTNVNDGRQQIGAQTPMIYALGKPISQEQLNRAAQQRNAALTALGKRMRKDDAIQIDHQIQRVNNPPLPLKKLEMSFVEEPPEKGFPDGHEPLAEGVRVIPDPSEQGRRV
jgi:hypothetical protein